MLRPAVPPLVAASGGKLTLPRGSTRIRCAKRERNLRAKLMKVLRPVNT